MKISTKQNCFDNESRSNKSYQPAAKGGRHKRLTRRGSLVVAALGLSVAIAACGSPTAEQPTDAGTATEAVQAPAADGDTASAIFAEDGVAIAGADPVAYFTEEAYVPGTDEYSYDWQGATWQFASAENRDLFAENPEQYAPEYGGFCAWAVAAKNTLVPVDPNAWSVVDGKLYLNANQKVQTNWLKDVPGFITEANDNWPSLSRS